MAGLSTREQCPFFELELQLHCVKEKWLSVTSKDGDDSYYSLDGALDAANEKASNNNLIVSGPMVVCYLKELGNQMHSKLTRGKITGIQSSSSILIPWQVMLNIMRLIKGYGGKVVAETKKNKEKLFTVTISHENCSGKVWHSKRCGRNLLSKRKYSKQRTSEDPNKKFKYSGCSKVVVTNSTPIIVSYQTKTQKAVMSFYVQRYDEQNYALDAALQAKLNRE